MTLSDLEADLYRRLGYDSSPAATVTTRLRAFLNETQRDLLGMAGMERMRDGLITVSTVADQEHVALPMGIARVKTITDRTNDVNLRQTDLRYIRQSNPNQNTGNPALYAVVSRQAVAVQPSNSSQLFVDSTSASDTNTAYLEGLRGAGFRVSVSVSMTGTTAVAFTHSDWTVVDKFYVDTAAVGAITLHEDAEGGTELSKIGIGQTMARYTHLLLEPVPPTALTLHIDFTREIDDMSVATDEPFLPSDFHRLLAVGARMKEYERREDGSRYRQAQTEYLLGVRELRYWIHTAGGTEANVMAPTEFSQLGSNYPAGS